MASLVFFGHTNAPVTPKKRTFVNEKLEKANFLHFASCPIDEKILKDSLFMKMEFLQVLEVEKVEKETFFIAAFKRPHFYQNMYSLTHISTSGQLTK